MDIVRTGTKRLKDYREIIPLIEYEKIAKLGEELKGLKVLHINATAFGGGVAEILHTLVPLMNDVGLSAEWRVIAGSQEFFELTKRMHNALQGKEDDLSENDINLFRSITKKNSDIDFGEYDVVVIHDPQPVALPEFVDKKNAKLVWRCHIDTSTPNKKFISFIDSFMKHYDAGIFTLKRYAGQLSVERLYEIPPSIDPLSDKNRELGEEEFKRAIAKLKIDPDKPVITQVSRFDPWKDPKGVVDTYRRLKKDYPDLQLLLIGSMATDDPEGWEVYEDLLRYVGMDYDIKVLTNLNGIGNIEVNAAQRISEVVLQKSLREGFALTVSEALWKNTPVIGGNVGGIPLQIVHGENGYLVNSVGEAIEYTGTLLKDPALRERMGNKGKEIVREKFLITRHLKDYLVLFRDLVR
ncbi:glycosyl transferase family 1 [Kosmotoga arenicorallina S304]|uniref:Glycosyl transferase family 1 n=1 Tax=Kosmotoga arenicorallina S304 TaxID=1453497 RepID=A0A176K0W9_9BACT|nr:glycosyltransferase [Kosmotoga arenicorallina]OAA30144.1 glycosyl transferase family 1 [Kosmotoga arenicorallina S304]